MQRLKTYKLTGVAKITIEIEACDDDEAFDIAMKTGIDDWQIQWHEFDDIENLGAVQDERE
jgi:hypothetical protein